jgi:hypothetical protein
LFCCQLCNQRFKRNHFPLADDSQRARSHHDDIGKEQPLLINPAVEDPAQFLEFRRNLIHPIDGNLRAEMTIEVFGLNRKDLRDTRLAWFLWFRLLIPHVVELVNTRETIASLVEDHPSFEHLNDLAKAEAELERFIGDSAQYAAMVRSAFRARNLS